MKNWFWETSCQVIQALDWAPSYVVMADKYLERLFGMFILPGYNEAGVPTVLALPHCSSVHTFGMKQHLDIVLIDGCGKVIALHENVGPGCMVGDKRAELILERFHVG
ncbi:hypothetical protein KPC83_06390 [Collinsella sp. zg1085]|uniref:hypothetical protein n=1 Tax=Collinsella sp. zg1085 TaxID=2844380 RepID=UPI001C0D9323|nr:hypothetical protein [Collinsella sp. zg1085]QWT17461.1 hypothetical protein KPC83_06390 [Collinsella sp. zg1085]